MHTTHSAIGFSHATGHVLAPVGGLAWLCIEISCKKNKFLLWQVLAKFCKSHFFRLCVCITFHLWPVAWAPGSNISLPIWHFYLEVSPLGISGLTCLTPNSRYFFHIPPVPHLIFHISVGGTNFHPVAQAKKLAVILGSSFSLYPTYNISASPGEVPFTLQPECSPFHLLCCHPHQNHHHFLAWATMIAFLLVSLFYSCLL